MLLNAGEILFSVKQHIQCQHSKNTVLQIGILVHVDRYHSYVRQKSSCPSYNILFGEPQLTRSVKASVVHRIVIPLGQELDRSVVLLVQLNHSMYDWNVATFDFEHNNFTHTDRFLLIGQEKQVPAGTISMQIVNIKKC